LNGGRGFVSRAVALGFTPGTEVTMVQNFRRSPLIVVVRDTHIALGRGEARKIGVRKLVDS
ncbi:MAG TPA: ferrous iron transport protein A, partial [Anaerolineae bacterium]|nr:ferrous iron transport protein A [Anaerolineae bacterium]